MSNKKETPVSWFAMITKKLGYVSKAQLEQAFKMESKKQQKYDEMLEMLEELVNGGKKEIKSFGTYLKAQQLIKEAKEL
jgi:Na+/phosphate symporter